MSTESDPPRLSLGGGPLAKALGAARARIPDEALLAAVAAKLPAGPPGGGDDGGGSDDGGGGADSTSSHRPVPGSKAVPGGGGAAGGGVPSLVPGILVGAALGGVVGLLSFLVPVEAPVAPAKATVAAPAPAQDRVSVTPSVTAAPSGAAASGPSHAASAGNGANGANAASTAGGVLPTGGDAAAMAPPGDASAGPETPPGSSAAALSGAGGFDENEVDYLRRAHGLVAGSPAQALAMAEAFPQKYPTGKLGQERDLIAIEALAGLGRSAEVRTRARAFLTLFPGSAHRRRIEVLIPDLAGSEKKPEP